ncbi:hypothetical protein V498_03581 [Pseudogymnoascus sp. VKM F-4517 (FW-2822)]|nr:hypothetical protein V498_03581 [Pseudogymnoascus sp. VKM F-4517 (FW-2822)]
MGFRDDWPQMPDGSDFDGKQLLTLVRGGNSPFHGVWDVNLLIQEIEENLDTQVVDIPQVYNGSNNYGFHFELSNRPDVIARLARGDVNMPDFDGFPIHKQIPEANFEVAAYELLRSDPLILASRLLHHRIPMQRVGPRIDVPQDILGRRLFVFERAEGENNIQLLNQSARIRASLFNFSISLNFAADWFLICLFEHKPEMLPIPVAPTREFCVALFTSKIEATIGKIDDMIGWESDDVTVGPIAAAAKQSLLRLIPYIIPTEDNESDGEPSLYRLVLEHGDFGIHNMSIAVEANGRPLVTSLYDWETGCIVPAILSDPLMAVSPVDLVLDENAGPSFNDEPDDTTVEEGDKYTAWAAEYFKVLFECAPDYERAIQAGKEARHLWFALRDWRGQDPEGYFGSLGDWAEAKMKDLTVI